MTLVRPSELARFWGLHPRTVNGWIKSGRLPGLRSPGDHFRLRVEDVRAFCAAEGRPIPPFAQEKEETLLAIGRDPALKRALRKAGKLTWFEDVYLGLVSAARMRASLVVLDATALDAERATRALAGLAPILVVGARRAIDGARVVGKGRPAEAARAAIEIMRGASSPDPG
jgi:excisionase family DNA binding protein